MNSNWFNWLCTAINVGILITSISFRQVTVPPQPVQAEQVIETWDIIQEPIEKKQLLICHDVCNGYDELVQYAWDLTKDMDFILTITQESHRDWKSEGRYWEQWLLQWTRDTQAKRDFIDSWEFKNPQRQVDQARKDRQRWIPYPEVINFQLKGYKERLKWANYFEIVN